MTKSADHCLLRRTSFIVEDVEATAGFYQQIFGWERFYDHETPVDRRFPPCAPDQTMGKIIILKADDPHIGMIGFMEYQDFKPRDHRLANRTTLGLGDAILIVEVNNIDAIYDKARKAMARLVTKPVQWSVKAHSGQGVIKLSTFSLFDPNGIYVEVNCRLPE